MSSKRDREILNAIVNPLLPVGEGVFDDEENVPQDLKDPPTQDSKETRCTLPDCKNELTRSTTIVFQGLAWPRKRSN